MEITHAELLETLRYEPESGLFFWVRRRKKVIPGMFAGTTDKYGYRVIKLCQRNYFAHRLAWLYVYGEWPNGLIDHANHDRSDNRICNLRDCTPRENMQNRSAADFNSKTGLLGVSPQQGKFIATIKAVGRQNYLGRFDTPEEASAAYLAAKRELHPFAT